MIEKSPFFFLFMSAVSGALFSSFSSVKILGVFLCLIAVVWFILLKVKLNVVLALSIFLMGLVWIEMPNAFPSGKFFLIGKVRSVSNRTLKISHVRFYSQGTWVKGRNTYIFLKDYNDDGSPAIQNTFMALVNNDNGKMSVENAFWLNFNTPLERIYKWGSNVSSFLYNEMKKYIFSESDTVASISLGRKDVSYEIRETYKNGGYAHIFAVSGMHVGFLAFVSLLVVSEFLPWNVSKYPLTFFIVLLYGFVTGFSIPTSRAIFIFGFYTFFKLADRPQKLLNVLGLVGVIEVILEPSIIFDVSFQLSYAAVVSIAILFPVLPKFRPQMLSDSLNLTLAANIGVIPFLILNYGKVYLASFFFNALIVPFLAMIILEGAFIFSFFSFLGMHFAERIVGAGIYPFAKMLDEVATITEKMPLSAVSVRPKVAFFWLTLSGAALLFFWVLFLRSKPDISGKYRKNSVDGP